MTVEKTSKKRKVFVVLGPFRGGTSLVAGVLEALGVFVGEAYFDASTDYCTYEDSRLRLTCLACFDERATVWGYRHDYGRRVSMLGTWIEWAQDRVTAMGIESIGAKHPILCKLIDEFLAACELRGDVDPVLIAVQRPTEQIHRSWTRATPNCRTHWWPRHDREAVVDDLIRSRDRALEHREHIRVDFEDLLSCPESTISRLADRCGLSQRRVVNAAGRIRGRYSGAK